MAELWSEIAEPYNLPYTAISSPYKRDRAIEGQYTRDNVLKQHRRVKVWESLRSEDGAIRYALKYATKPNQKNVPVNYRDVGRFWAVSSGIRVNDSDEVPATEQEIRMALEYLGRNMAGFEVLPKYIFHSGALT
jgi:hypothetical protein